MLMKLTHGSFKRLDSKRRARTPRTFHCEKYVTRTRHLDSLVRVKTVISFGVFSLIRSPKLKSTTVLNRFFVVALIELEQSSFRPF
jgi:hypothetical protein